MRFGKHPKILRLFSVSSLLSLYLPYKSCYGIKIRQLMKNSNLTLLLLLSALLPITSVYSQNAEKQRLKANLEEAFSKTKASAPRTADGIIYYVQVLSSVKPIEGTGEKALRDFTDLKSYREDRYLKYYTGPGTDYKSAKELMKSVHAKGYPTAFVIAFKYGIKIDIKDALSEQGLQP